MTTIAWIWKLNSVNSYTYTRAGLTQAGLPVYRNTGELLRSNQGVKRHL